MDAYTVIRKNRNRKDTVTWCTKYNFDIETGEIVLYGDAGGVCGKIKLDDGILKQLDIYNAKRPMDPPVQTFLPKEEAQCNE